MCGTATDISLRCAINTLKEHLGVPLSLCIASCCHHRCDVSELCGVEYLYELGITKEHYQLLTSVTGWAAGTTDERSVIGFKAKRVIDACRIRWLRANGLEDARLHVFVPLSVSLENIAIIATNTHTHTHTPLYYSREEAALFAFAALAENSLAVLSPFLTNFVELLLSKLSDPSPLMRHTVLLGLTSLCNSTCSLSHIQSIGITIIHRVIESVRDVNQRVVEACCVCVCAMLRVCASECDINTHTHTHTHLCIILVKRQHSLPSPHWPKIP
eukprot:GHVR01132003.1.p1 GENE.GHVR01132003.1~~GHVR01132003.1.p1  ORF type:complete len:272 (+),score=91.84 GHVR01132003.1:275-1090(+)